MSHPAKPIRLPKALSPEELDALRAVTCTEAHPYTFWLHLGFRVVGVMPDAEGRYPVPVPGKSWDDVL